MLLRHVALVTETKKVSFSKLSRVAAALQKQALRDLRSSWNITATVDAFDSLEDVPMGYWPILVMENINTPGAAGVHEDEDGQPFALVQFSPGWSLTASHECLEMLVDPFGNRLVASQSPKPGQGRVEFLVEVCDPSEDAAFAYTVNGVTVSDFYTPAYFDPVANSAVRYSFTGALKKPRQVLKGGYLSWHDPITDHWFQQTFFSGNAPKFVDLGRLTAKAGKSIRAQIYERTPQAFRSRDLSGKALTASNASIETVEASTGSKAQSLRAQVKELMKG